ncbi:hypothetical protein [Aliikangiella coralliicola]|uniref:hypothetical protein n=1 Tax=Aliikangiella coralliicola TaxID=2592383 RepID=UPI001AF02040|nr:hypothetical protein [Aliikangiella coralliicola]
MKADIPNLIQESGVPFDMFIQALTEQLDKAQASMALKARVGKMPLTFAVKEVDLDLKAFVEILDDEVYVRPAGPGDTEASTIKLGLTTITKPMIEENAIDFEPGKPEISLRDALGGGQESEDTQRKLERIGVRNVNQLVELRKTAGSDVIARLARLPHNRLQRLLKVADAPRVQQEVSSPVNTERQPGMTNRDLPARLRVRSPLIDQTKMPKVFARGERVPVVELKNGELLLEPLAVQLGSDAILEWDNGEKMPLQLIDGFDGSLQALEHLAGSKRASQINDSGAGQ